MIKRRKIASFCLRHIITINFVFALFGRKDEKEQICVLSSFRLRLEIAINLVFSLFGRKDEKIKRRKIVGLKDEK